MLIWDPSFLWKLGLQDTPRFWTVLALWLFLYRKEDPHIFFKIS